MFSELQCLADDEIAANIDKKFSNCNADPDG